MNGAANCHTSGRMPQWQRNVRFISSPSRLDVDLTRSAVRNLPARSLQHIDQTRVNTRVEGVTN